MTNPIPSDYQPSEDLLAQQVILVTGAADGIGRAVSIDSARHGATVIILDKTVSKLESLYDEIVDAGHPEPAIYPLDLKTANWDDYQALANTIETEFGKLNGLVLNAAWVGAVTPFVQTDIETYLNTMTISLHSPFLTAKACIPLLQKSDDPCVVISTHKTTKAYWGGFGMAKAGLQGMLEILAHEYDVEHQPIRVNGIDSGPVNTYMRRTNYPGENSSELRSPKDITSSYLFFLGADSKGSTGTNVELS